jgi:hypothetical protein
MTILTSEVRLEQGVSAAKLKAIGYWATTGLLVFCMTGGVFELLSLDMTVAGIVSHVAVNDPAWSVAVTVAIAAITLASWALRPENRR